MACFSILAFICIERERGREERGERDISIYILMNLRA